jgi:peptidoglycan L-alanyl-D-glutamate endopeptidase CwlK
MSRSLNDLHPAMQPMAAEFLNNCKAAGIDLLVTCTWRSGAEQDALYAQGRTTPGSIVTRAKAGQSRHNHTLSGRPASLALDVVPLRLGKPVWAASDAIWQDVGRIGKACGLEWAGEWTRMREFPHFQHPNAKAIAAKEA